MERQALIKELKLLAVEQRRRLIALSESYSGNIHLGGDMSMSDMLIALYHYGMNLSVENISSPDRDRFVLSKGHAAVSMYIAMSLKGFMDFEEIKRTYGQLDSAYGMHPCKVRLSSLECSSGSLGQGLSMAIGMALMARRRNHGARVFCMMGDGETCEGSVWEAAMYAGSAKLNNLIALVDRNRQMMTSYTDVPGANMNLEPYADKWRAFGWHVIVVEDGNDMEQLIDALDAMKAYEGNQPTAIIFNTVKGHGISYMERVLSWHSGSVTHEQAAVAFEELEKERMNLQ